MDRGMQVLIVGSVACGPKVACRLKRLDPSTKITVLERGLVGWPFELRSGVSEKP
jgi:hypothetical protein